VEYPVPYAGNGMRDFFMDSQGRMWWASMTHNRLGYFIPVEGNGAAPAAGTGLRGPQEALRQE